MEPVIGRQRMYGVLTLVLGAAFGLVSVRDAAAQPGRPPELVLPLAHQQHIETATASSDGKLLAATSPDSASLWDAQSGRQVRLIAFLDIGPGDVTAFSPGDTYLAVSRGSRVALYEVATGRFIKYLSAYGQPTARLAFTPDGRHLAIADQNGIGIVEVSTNKQVKYIDIPGRLYSMFFQRDNGALNVVYNRWEDSFLLDRYTATQWDRQEILEFKSGVDTLQLVPAVDGKSLFLIQPDGIYTCDIASGRKTKLHGLSLPIFGEPHLSRDGRRLLIPYRTSADDGGGAVVYDVVARKLLWQRRPSSVAPEWSLRGLAFSRDGREVLGGMEEKLVRFDAATGREIGRFSGSERLMPLSDAAFGQQSVLLETPKGLFRWPTDTNGVPRVLPKSADAAATELSTDGKVLFRQQPIMVVAQDAASGSVLREFKPAFGTMRSFALSGDGRLLATISAVRPIREQSRAYNPNKAAPERAGEMLTLWDARTGTKLDEKFSETAINEALRFSPDGRTLATWSSSAISLWDVANRQLQERPSIGFASYSDYSDSAVVDWKPGNKIIAGASRNVIKLWQAGSGKQLFSVQSPINDLQALRFSNDGRTLAAAGRSGVGLWNGENGRPLRLLDLVDEPISQLDFSRDGRKLLGCGRTHAYLWNVSTGKLILTLAFTQAGGWLATSPSGPFDAAPQLMPQLYWRIGNASAPLEQYKARYYQPGLLRKVLRD